MVRWLWWHCPPDTGFEIRALAVWGRARYLSVTEAPHNTDFHTWMGKKHFFVSFKPPRPGAEPRTLAWKAAVLTTTLGPPPIHQNTNWQTERVIPMLFWCCASVVDVGPIIGQHWVYVLCLQGSSYSCSNICMYFDHLRVITLKFIFSGPFKQILYWHTRNDDPLFLNAGPLSAIVTQH